MHVDGARLLLVEDEADLAAMLRDLVPEAENPVAVDASVHHLRRELGRGVVDTVRGRRPGRG